MNFRFAKSEPKVGHLRRKGLKMGVRPGGSAGRAGCGRGFWSLQKSEFDSTRLLPRGKGPADLRRKRQPAAHAVPCISETAEKEC